MHKRYQHLNVPIEIVRTVVAISETGSLSKAGHSLGLSQPAVSSQLKRIQTLVGGNLFHKTPNGTATTELGKLVLQQARRMLTANDQLLRIGGAAEGPQPLRLGLSTLFVQEFVRHQTAETLRDIFIQTDHSVAIGKGLVDGFIDVACLFEHPDMYDEISHLVVNTRHEKLVWVRSKEFVHRPDTPIPVLTWPGDDWMVRTLTQNEIPYKIVFNSPDYHAKLAAVEAGIGLTAIPESMVPASLVKARDYYLPELPAFRALLCVRAELAREHSGVVNQLTALFFHQRNN